jgi:hypothetical protein
MEYWVLASASENLWPSEDNGDRFKEKTYKCNCIDFRVIIKDIRDESKMWMSDIIK